GVTAETSQVDVASQHTVDSAERPGAESTAPTAQHPEPAPQTESFERVHEEPAASDTVSEAPQADVTLSEAPEGNVTLSEAPEGNVTLSEAREASEVEGQAAVAPSEAPPETPPEETA